MCWKRCRPEAPQSVERDSGHVIFLQHHTTGDGIITALQVIAAMKKEGKPLSELAKVMDVFPQSLINVDTKSRPEISTVPEMGCRHQIGGGKTGNKRSGPRSLLGHAEYVPRDGGRPHPGGNVSVLFTDCRGGQKNNRLIRHIADRGKAGCPLR